MPSLTTESVKVLIAVPTFETILPDTFKSIYGLEIPEGVYCFFDFVRGYDCAKARNEIALEAIKHNFDYVLMVDSDIVLPSHALQSMLEVPVDICLGVYPRKNTASEQVEIFKLGYDNYVVTYNMPELENLDSLIEVKGGGFGCALLRTEIFGTLPFPWFRYVTYQTGDVLSEDNYFCSKAAKNGFTIYCDPRVKCGHAVRSIQWR